MSKRILIVTDVCFGVNSGAGNRTAVTALVKNLSKNSEVEVLNINRKKPVEFLSFNRVSIIRINNFFPIVYRKLKNTLLRFFKVEQDMYSYAESNFVKKKIVHFMDKKYYDIIIIEYIHMHYLYEALVDKCKYIFCDTHDVFFQRAISYRNKGVSIPTIFNTTLNEEIERLNKYDCVIAIQEDEARLLSEFIDGNKIITVPRISDVSNVYQENFFEEKISLGILANTADFNVDAVNYFLSQILPEVKKDKIRMVVAGSICKYFPDVYQGLEIFKLGYVDDLSRFYSEINILINPVRIGSGLKTKNVEAMQYVRPVLTTEVGAQGLKKYVNRGIFIFNNGEDFDRIIDNFYSNPFAYKALISDLISISKNELTEEHCFCELNKLVDNHEN